MTATREWRVILRKHRATWYYTTENERGGSFGSNYCGPKYIAMSKATHHIPAGTVYRLIVNDKDCGTVVR